MFGKYFRFTEWERHKKQVTLYPGGLTYDVAKFILANRLSSRRGLIWYSNVRPLVDKHGRKIVLRAIHRLRRVHGMDICKPKNKQFQRPHVWQITNYEKFRLWTPPRKDGE